ncbi:hypothetical protein J1C56_21775 [Aminobacter anthyllidis]|uniref:Uncharacterized protein n=1 Tax=Aminobacter anthyllidis TaxID=1035067 RepID=A0A9X1AEH0_9HYPH|nr:hypothetical protein [Aminobacter anthyllidis]MBT1158233.1 hypothetical protein [Aminobacter anthyllidis]
MLTQVIRAFFRSYGYRFLATEDLLEMKGRTYASLSIVEDEDGERKMLFRYWLDEATRTQVLSRENVEGIIASCRTLLDHSVWSEGPADRLNSSL